jgi:hypothetical protein
LGLAFNKNVFGAGMDGDLEFSYRTLNGDVVAGTVDYVSGSLPGDFDGDSDVDGADFLKWQREFATLGAAGLAQWKANFGAGAATETLATVPEPSSLALVFIGFVAAGRKLLRRGWK